MNNFSEDLEWGKKQIKYLEPMFKEDAYDGRYVISDDLLLQGNGIDVLIQRENEQATKLEIKCVRGKNTHFFIETMSCSVDGLEKNGWIFSSKADKILYCQCEENYIYCYIIELPKLRSWFLKYINQFKPKVTNQLNKTIYSLVDVDVVKKHVGFKEKIIKIKSRNL